ncbi:MAG: hypothetical protein IE909_08265 [Campylobacterales bacterium]|nr:hypothetical protein [Campylobacterales bacterium]
MALIDKLFKEAKSTMTERNKKISFAVSEEEFNTLNDNSKLTGKSKQELLYLACIEAGLFKQLKNDRGVSNENAIE